MTEPTPAPLELLNETDLQDLWLSCAELQAFSDGSANTIEVFISPSSFISILSRTIRISCSEPKYEIGGGFGIRFYITNCLSYSIKGFTKELYETKN